MNESPNEDVEHLRAERDKIEEMQFATLWSMLSVKMQHRSIVVLRKEVKCIPKLKRWPFGHIIIIGGKNE